MFRKMRRNKQELSLNECIEILKSEPRGVLSVIGDNGYPYGIPMNHWYNEKDGTLCFHGAKTGHKTDALKSCNKVSFCVYDKGYRNDGEWALNIRSVVVFGKIEFVEDYDEAMDICENLCKKFTNDTAYIKDEIKNFGSAVLCLKLTPEHISGKRVKEA